MQHICDLERLSRRMSDVFHGVLHAVVDDGNLEDHHIQLAIESKDISKEELWVANELLSIPMHLRVAAYEMQGYID